MYIRRMDEANKKGWKRPATRIRFSTPEQMKAKANTTSEQSNEKSMEVGNPCMAEMEE